MWDDNRIEFKSPEKVLHEHKRAPTDESIRLAIEYEEKILSKIIDKFYCVDNVVKFSYFKLHEHLGLDTFVFKMCINEREFSEKFKILLDFDKTIEDIIHWVAETIVRPVISDVYIRMNQR